MTHVCFAQFRSSFKMFLQCEAKLAEKDLRKLREKQEK